MSRHKDETNSADLLRGNTVLLVLAVLRDGAAHGYAIGREVARRSGEALEFKAGTLYPLLNDLEREGWVESRWSGPGEGRPKRVYELTESGRSELMRRVGVWTAFSQAVSQVVEGGPREVGGGG